jgi:hypothetical protein
VTVEHTVSECQISAKEQYVKRHEGVSAQLHFNICKNIGVKLDNKHRYNHVPKSADTSQVGKVIYYGTNKCEPTELFLTINRT